MTKKVNRTQTRSAIGRDKITINGSETVSAMSNFDQNEESEASDELCNVNEDED